MSSADLDRAASTAGLATDDDVVELYNAIRLVYRCEQCGRLHVYWDREQSWPPSVYLAEPDAYREN